MINEDRIIPITKIDFLSVMGTVLNLTSTSFEVLKPVDVEGNFMVDDASTYLANQPVKSIDFTESTGAVFFCPDYDFKGILVSGAEATVSGADYIEPEYVGLYFAELSSGTVTVTALTPTFVVHSAQ